MNLDALRAAITGAYPELSGASFTILSGGWDSIAVDVDDRLVFKFPRHAEATRRLETEAKVLAVIRPAVTMPVPDLTFHTGSPPFSRHAKLRGEHLLTPQYLQLPIEARRRLAADMALFYAELHGLDANVMAAAGARAIKSWLAPDEILACAWPALSADLRSFAQQTINAWQQLAPDPYGTAFGFFDGHGWNMAFDPASHRLNGVYDFADSGFGALHQDFIYSNWVARDLTMRIVAEYEALTRRVLDRERVDLLTGVHRLSELAEYAGDPQHAPGMIQAIANWVASGATAIPRP